MHIWVLKQIEPYVTGMALKRVAKTLTSVIASNGKM
jgi:hypothetical protein